ncbi:MAG: FkbM family methyltransferase [Bdellovibrionales bacterium]
MSALEKLIHPNTLNFYDLAADAVTKETPPLTILNSNRLDVMARYIYAKSKITGKGKAWGKHCYHELIRAWSQDFKLPPPWEPGRSSMQDYWDQFNALIESMRKNGYDPQNSIVPVCENTLVDGAHRLAASLACEVDNINTVELHGEQQIQNYATMKKIGIDEDVLLNMIYEFVKLKTGTRLAILFPVAQNIQQQFISKLEDNFRVDYIESFPISMNGLTNLQDFFYDQHKWWNDWHCEDFAKSRSHKTNSNVTIVFFQDNDNVRDVKDQIRKLHSSDTHVMHTTDTHEETILAAEVLLNNNGRDYLNFKDKSIKPEKFKTYFDQFSTLVKQQGIINDVVLDTGSILALYGIRDIQDMDYISSTAVDIKTDDSLISKHAEGYDILGIDIDDMIYDPKNHFVYKGIKCVCLDKVLELKKARAAAKDLHDVELIKELKNASLQKPSVFIPRFINKTKYKLIMAYYSYRNATVRFLQKALPEQYFNYVRSGYRYMKKCGRSLKIHIKNLLTRPGYIHNLRWRIIKGDETKRLNYKLKDNSVVIDVGGYKGEWAASIFELYKPSIHVFEPVEGFVKKLDDTFKDNQKIAIYPYGIGGSSQEIEISLDADASSVFSSKGDKTLIQIRDIIEFLDEQNIQKIDLIKLNIEGGEFDLLDRLIETGYLERFNHLQIQFHNFVENAQTRRDDIRQKLAKTHHCDWNFPFVWEGWSKHG